MTRARLYGRWPPPRGGLVREWGEVVPAWVPVLGGRRVRPLAAVVPALLGAAALFGLPGWACHAQAAELGAKRV
ncbi:hypothetical protein [Streptomyces sp. NPDC020607]|uniref:hypothetical protein n=1 Tax=Streptomyces sp. NPDC020607 TaxID=3365082 RepID=UPI0037B888EB